MNTTEFLLKIKDIKNKWEKIEKLTKSDEYYLIRRYVNLPTKSEIKKNFIEIEGNNLINDIKKSLSIEDKELIINLIEGADINIISNIDKITKIFESNGDIEFLLEQEENKNKDLILEKLKNKDNEFLEEYYEKKLLGI